MNGKKLLIIGNDPLVIQALDGAYRTFGFDKIVSCGHAESTSVFFKQIPTHIIINDYDEKRKGFDEGFDTWETLISNKKPHQIMIRSGYPDYNYPDYIKLPFERLELKRVSQGE